MYPKTVDIMGHILIFESIITYGNSNQTVIVYSPLLYISFLPFGRITSAHEPCGKTKLHLNLLLPM